MCVIDDYYPSKSVCDFDVIVLSETWLKDSTRSEELFSDTYQVFRKDRKLELLDVATGGGVLIALKNSIHVTLTDTKFFDENYPYVEFICCRCSINHIAFYIMALYIPPNLALYDFDRFFEATEEWNVLTGAKAIILGDFNTPKFFLNYQGDELLYFSILNEEDDIHALGIKISNY
nr:unnamed protein product [Callosobruchus chinensis]